MSLELIYDSLWDSMEHDFDSLLDSDSFEGFQQNIDHWVGDHDSPAVQAVAAEMWNQLHEDEPPIDVDTGYEIKAGFRETETGHFASPAIVDSLIQQHFVDESTEFAVQQIIQEELSGEEIPE